MIREYHIIYCVYCIVKCKFIEFIFYRTHGLSWCPIYKAASSTWMKHFATLGGVLTESAMELIRKNILQINTIVRKAFPRDRDVKKVYQVCNI